MINITKLRELCEPTGLRTFEAVGVLRNALTEALDEIETRQARKPSQAAKALDFVVRTQAEDYVRDRMRNNVVLDTLKGGQHAVAHELLAAYLSGHAVASDVTQPINDSRYLIDHGMIHDRITGKHVHIDALRDWATNQITAADAEVDRVGAAGAHHELLTKQVLTTVLWLLDTGLPPST